MMIFLFRNNFCYSYKPIDSEAFKINFCDFFIYFCFACTRELEYNFLHVSVVKYFIRGNCQFLFSALHCKKSGPFMSSGITFNLHGKWRIYSCK